jgi:hypothetical protein
LTANDANDVKKAIASELPYLERWGFHVFNMVKGMFTGYPV